MKLSSGHTALVGATSPIGLAIANRLAASGETLVLVGRDEMALARLTAALPGLGHSTCRLDLADHAAYGPALAEAASANKLDRLVYCAGLHRLTPLRALNANVLQEIFFLNAAAPLLMVKAFTSRLVSQSSSTRKVVAIASVAHRQGEPALTAYSAAKAALVAGFRSLAVELAPQGVRINTVSPGWIHTVKANDVTAALGSEAATRLLQRYPLGAGRPEDVSEVVQFLLSEGADHVTGQDWLVDGGRSAV